MAKKDFNPHEPPRKQDPYVTGTGRGYISGGEGNSGNNGGGNNGKKDEGCGEATAKLAIGVTTAFFVARFALRSLTGRR